MGMQPCIFVAGEFSGESDAVALDDDIDIRVTAIQEQIPHKAPDHVGPVSAIFGNAADFFQRFNHFQL